MQLFLYGPPADVEAAVIVARTVGWQTYEHATLPSGSAIALVGGPTLDAKSGAPMDKILDVPRLKFGPDLSTLDQRLER